MNSPDFPCLLLDTNLFKLKWKNGPLYLLIRSHIIDKLTLAD
jgi:hypothetical protein